MIFTSYFALNSVFTTVCVAETLRLRKIIKIDTYCEQCKSLAGTLVSSLSARGVSVCIRCSLGYSVVSDRGEPEVLENRG